MQVHEYATTVFESRFEFKQLLEKDRLEELKDLPIDSPVGVRCRRLIDAADVVLSQLDEPREREQLVETVVNQMHVWYFG